MADHHPLQDLPPGSSVRIQMVAPCHYNTDLHSITFPHTTSTRRKHNPSLALSNKSISGITSLMDNDPRLLIHLQIHMLLAHSPWVRITPILGARISMAASTKIPLMVHQVGLAPHTPEQKQTPLRHGGRDKHPAAAL